MSRIGKRILTIPDGVTVNIESDNIAVKGPKGELFFNVPEKITIEQEEDKLLVKRVNDTKSLKQKQGTVNAIISNMLEGVTSGFKRELEIVGVGYRFQLKGNNLVINAGYSHPVEISIPDGLSINQISNTEIVVMGIDKEKVGELAANIRKVKSPEPYKGKGIRYKDEYVRRKEGKKAS
ncbi:MAG: 50S ribosomal protein L6 [Bacilli bacterium]|jgi:large subunit ribosomal protein L6|nr:50S ribosomal protein L6 [Bacilli bacterium]